MTDVRPGTNQALIQNIRALMYAIVGMGGRLKFNLQGLGQSYPGPQVPNAGDVDAATRVGEEGIGFTNIELFIVRTDPVLFTATDAFVPAAGGGDQAFRLTPWIPSQGAQGAR